MIQCLKDQRMESVIQIFSTVMFPNFSPPHRQQNILRLFMFAGDGAGVVNRNLIREQSAM